MENGSKQCFRCKKFERYYVKGNIRFNKTKCGRCFKNGENVNIHDCCEDFDFKPVERRVKYSAKHYLNDLLTQISAIRCVIEDTPDEEL